MHPLTSFPELLSYSFFAPTLLRVVAAFVFMAVARAQWRGRAESVAALSPLAGPLAGTALLLVIAIEWLAAVALFFGWHVQMAAVAGAILALKYLFIRNHALSPLPAAATWLLMAACLSLIVLGAGALAFDIPL